MSDPLTRATKSILWPYLQAEGFSQLTSRKFVREKNEVFQQLWVDANGVAGRRGTQIVLCANFPFGPVTGYLDPHGFRILDGRSWNTSNPDSAAANMQRIVSALKLSELAKLDAISNIENMLALLANEKFAWREWYGTYSQLYREWLEEDAEALAKVRENRETLKL